MGGLDESVNGPMAVPGDYRVRLQVDGLTFSQWCEVRKNPLNPSTQQDLEAQHNILMQLRDKTSEISGAVVRLRKVRGLVEGWLQRLGDSEESKRVEEAGQAIRVKLHDIESELIHVPAPGAPSLDGAVKLYSKLPALNSVIASADYAPTKQAVETYQDIAGRVDAQISLLNDVIEQDVPEFNRMVGGLNIEPVTA